MGSVRTGIGIAFGILLFKLILGLAGCGVIAGLMWLGSK
jgi:hypothetical protein